MPHEPMCELPDPPLPLLITGITGVAGYNAYHYFRDRYGDQVVAIRQENNWRLNGPGIVACDAENCQGLSELFHRYRFGSVLNCAGNCALKSCELDPAMAWRTNVEGLRNLLEVTDSLSVRFVHLSIDLVFSGATGRSEYHEHDPTDPVTQYGKSMAGAEELLLWNRPCACLLRISLPMGISLNGHAGAIDWIQSRFKQNKPATLYYDEIRTPTYTDCLNRVCHAVLANELAGLYHAGGPRRLSLYQIAQIVNRVGGYDPGLLQGCYRRQAGPIPPRAGNVTMDSGKLATTLQRAPFDPWPFAEEWVPTDRQWHFRGRDAEPGSATLLAEQLYRNPAYDACATPG